MIDDYYIRNFYLNFHAFRQFGLSPRGLNLLVTLTFLGIYLMFCLIDLWLFIVNYECYEF